MDDSEGEGSSSFFRVDARVFHRRADLFGRIAGYKDTVPRDLADLVASTLCDLERQYRTLAAKVEAMIAQTQDAGASEHWIRVKTVRAQLLANFARELRELLVTKGERVVALVKYEWPYDPHAQPVEVPMRELFFDTAGG